MKEYKILVEKFQLKCQSECGIIKKKINFKIEVTIMEVTKEYTYITNYNQGKIDGIKEFAKELKQYYSCYYDLADYISFEAITTSTVAEVADSMIKKISRQ